MLDTNLGFPLGVRLTHWFQVLFLILLARSGLAILAAHPKLYWNIHARPGSEWLSFTRKVMPKDRLWCSTDEEEEWPSWLALPGGSGLGLGRYWHFAGALGWLLCGMLYLGVLFTSTQWRRIVPTSVQVVPEAFHDMLMYLTLRTPPPGGSYSPTPFNPLQQLTYFFVVFLLAPLQILTGLAQSPSILARFPWYDSLFGGRQAARSLHFIGLVAFLGFLVIHVVMVVWHGFGEEMGKIILGQAHSHGSSTGAVLGAAVIVLLLLINVAASAASELAKRPTHRLLSALVDPVRRSLLHCNTSWQAYPPSQCSHFFRVNGYPPISAYPQAKGDDDTYERLLASGFADYRLEISGLIEQPCHFSLDELRALPRQDQITLHHCIQGWTSIAKWSGVLVGDLLERCRPRPEARYLVFESFGMHETSGRRYYECIDIQLACHPQTILAYEMNDEPLPIQHGAPVRLRVETKLGFKMVKFLRNIEVVADVRDVGGGMGGIREDIQQFDMGAEI